MKHTIKILGQNLILSARLVAEGVAFPNEDSSSGLRHNHFKVSVKGESKSISFDFYGSHHDYQNGVQELDAKNLVSAFNSLASDACAGKDDFENFCAEFGYDVDSRSAERIHKACVKSTTKLEKLFGDIYEVANQVGELENAQ